MSKPLALEDLEHIWQHTADLWEPIRGERIFITGATGFFGAWLLESFAFLNDRLGLQAKVVFLTRDPDSWRRRMPHLAHRSDLVAHQGDVRSGSFPEGTFRCVVHAATTAAFAIDLRENFATIVDGTRRVLDFANTAGVRRFLLTSSGAIYGRQPVNLSHVPESFTGAPDPLHPASTYGEAKRAAELLCVLGQGGGMETTIARCFAFVGPHLPLDQHFAIGNFLRDSLAGKPIRIQGDGTPYRSYLHAADLSVWLWTLLFRGVAGRAYNVGSDEAISIADLARRLQPNGVVEIAQKPSGEPPSRYVPDITRAQTELGLRVAISLNDSISRTRAWLQP